MLYSTLRSTLMAAVVVGLSACQDGTPLSLEPVDKPTAVFTESVLATVDGTVIDAQDRLLPALADSAFSAELSMKLDELNAYVAARDISRAELSLLDARAMLARTDVSLEVQDFAHDLSAIELLLDQTEALIDRAAGRIS
jgi:hypothetical protein